MRGLDPRIHRKQRLVHSSGWIAGSSPAMTANGSVPTAAGIRTLGAARWAKSLGTDSLRRAARSLSIASVLPPRRDEQSQTGRIGADQDQIVASVVIADRRM